MEQAEDKIPGTRITVIIRDDSPMIHYGDVPYYRRVTFGLTEDQQKAIMVKATSTVGSMPIYEAISKVFIED